jgi:hypothetical protein
MPRERDRGQIGDCQAESFCERVFFIAKGVIKDGNVGLDDDCIGKVTTLRANARFMQSMRENHLAEVFAAAKTEKLVQKVQEAVVLEDYCDPC